MKYHYAQFNSFEIKLPESCVNACHHSGACDADVTLWLKDGYVKKELAKIDANKLADELRNYGAWDEIELSNHNDNLARILWIAAANIQEELFEKQSS
jgi:hypothetical protein